jgi:DNA-binding FrmR family transcriptional regulator
MKPDTREQTRKRLRRVAGQIAGLERMIDEDRYCVDVLNQIAAARAALDGIGKLILRAHVETCVAEAFVSGSPKERKQKIDEVMESISKLAHVGGR